LGSILSANAIFASSLLLSRHGDLSLGLRPNAFLPYTGLLTLPTATHHGNLHLLLLRAPYLLAALAFVSATIPSAFPIAIVPTTVPSAVPIAIPSATAIVAAALVVALAVTLLSGSCGRGP